MARGDHWYEVSVEVAGLDAELAADVLRQACPGGVSIELSHRYDPESDSYLVEGDGPAVVRGYMPPGTDVKRVGRSLRIALAAAPLSGPPRWRRARRLREPDWRDAWKRHFGLQRMGRRLVVKPSWVRYAAREGEVVVEIDPGLAFGTGQHPTTAMCLRELERLVRPGAKVLDLGCGSGILAIAAAKLGAGHVLALDVDPQAVEAARRNVEANGVAHLVEVKAGTLESASAGFDLILANISGLTLERLAPVLAGSLGPGGALVMSGFLEDAVAGLQGAYQAQGLAVERLVAEGDWRTVVARRDAGSSA